MRRWIIAGDGQWWIDRDPPPDIAGEEEEDEDHDQATVVEEVTWRLPAQLIVARALGRRPDPGDLWALLAGEDTVGVRGIGADERRLRLEGLIERRRLRAWWRRRRRATTGGGGNDAPGDVAPQAPAPPAPRSSPSERATPWTSAASLAGRVEGAVRAALGDRLSWYEFVLIDELDTGIPGVLVEMTTPRGTAWRTTGPSGAIRVDEAPPGLGVACVSPESLALALQGRVRGPRRTSRPPNPSADFVHTTPGRLPAAFRFPDARPHRVMVISRTDVVVAGSDPRWRALTLDPASRLVCSLAAETRDALALCSRGLGEAGRVHAEPPAAPDPVSPRAFPEDLDPLLDLPFDLIPQPGAWPAPPAEAAGPWFDGGLDDIHHALIDGQGDRLFDLLARPLARAPEAAAAPVADPPIDAQAEAARQAAAVAAELGVDASSLFEPTGEEDDRLFEPLPERPPPPDA